MKLWCNIRFGKGEKRQFKGAFEPTTMRLMINSKPMRKLFYSFNATGEVRAQRMPHTLFTKKPPLIKPI